MLVSFKQIALTLSYIFTPARTPTEKTECVRNRLLVMQGYEVAVEHFVSVSKKNDLQSDEEVVKHLTLLKPFYFDKMLLKDNLKNKKRLEMICLDLLIGLVNQRFRDYYCLLERLTAEERSTEVVNFVCSIEESLMEGNYSQLLKVSAMKGSKGFSKLFQRSVEKLEETVKNEVAQCMETSYGEIGEKEALAMLKNDSKKKKATLPENWKVVGGKVIFDNEVNMLHKEVKITSEMSNNLIKETVGFAKELEKIV